MFSSGTVKCSSPDPFAEPVQHALQGCALVHGAPLSFLTVLPESIPSPPAQLLWSWAALWFKLHTSSVSSTTGKEQKGKRLQTVSEEQHQRPPLFSSGGHRAVAMVGLGVMLKGISVLSELRTCFLLSGLGEGQVVKNIMMLLPAETLTADSCRRPSNPAPSFPGWIQPPQDRDETHIQPSIPSFNTFHSLKQHVFPFVALGLWWARPQLTKCQVLGFCSHLLVPAWFQRDRLSVMRWEAAGVKCSPVPAHCCVCPWTPYSGEGQRKKRSNTLACLLIDFFSNFLHRKTFFYTKPFWVEREVHPHQAKEKQQGVWLHRRWRRWARWIPPNQKFGAWWSRSAGWQNGNRYWCFISKSPLPLWFVFLQLVSSAVHKGL